MPMTSIHCHVLGANVTCVTDLEGRITRLMCPEYDEPTGSCRIRRRALDGGPLTQLLERIADDTLDRRGARCDLR
jgi:hypothetical protein